MRSTFTCLILGWALAMAGLVSCFRVPVQVVQYQDEAPVTVAPVGKVFISTATATQPQTAVMNPRVMDPEKVGPLPPKPEPSETDWIGIALGVLGATIPALGGLGYLWTRLRASATAASEMAQGIQAVKDRLFPKHEDGTNPQMRDEVNKILEIHQKKSKKTVQKIIAKNPQ
jgi:hypothetical protein